MKLTVHNLGRIKDAELDIKPLTVFSGHNGTNKTWLAWTLFELLRPVSTGPNAPDVLVPTDTDPFAEKVREKLKPLFEALGQGTSTAAVTLDVGAWQAVRSLESSRRRLCYASWSLEWEFQSPPG